MLTVKTPDEALEVIRGSFCCIAGEENVPLDQADIPLIHGAVCGWCCQYGVSMPGSGLLHRIYSGAVPKDNGVLPFVPPFCGPNAP